MTNWYINRLRSFSILEFPYRIRQFVSKYFQSAFYLKKKTPSLEITSSAGILHYYIDKQETNTFPFEIFGKKFDYLGEIDWHKDIFSGKSFPRKFAKNIDIKSDEQLSAKVVWEINRLQFLPRISIEFKKSGNEKQLEKFMNIIESWQLNNQYLIGINWYSNIEVNLRLITWFLCWEVLEVEMLMKNNLKFERFVSDIWIPLIYQHCLYSYKNPSKYSSANNHLISEYAGLFVASSKWNFKESPKWLEYSRKGLETEMVKQHSRNGINKEEAAEYIQFITDFFLLAYVVGENTNRPFSIDYKERLYQIFDYIWELMDCAGNFPKYGDEDDGRCFNLNFDPHFNNFKSLITSAAVIFNSAKFKAKSNGLDSKNLFLFGENGKKRFETVREVPLEIASKFYKEEGHFFFRNNQNNKEIFMHFNAAPLGFLSIAAHGHADALSFILHIDGEPFFVDPGTYTYHTQRDWRYFFIGTLAHNTIRINKENQALIAGPTLWLNHYRTRILKSELNQMQEKVKAEHNGYLKFGIIHTREIIYQKREQYFKIIDTITSSKADRYLIEQPFHLHPSVKISCNRMNDFLLINEKNNQVKLKIDKKLDSEIYFGRDGDEKSGWYSPSFMNKKPTTSIICSYEGNGTTILETIISIN